MLPVDWKLNQVRGGEDSHHTFLFPLKRDYQLFQAGTCENIKSKLVAKNFWKVSCNKGLKIAFIFKECPLNRAPTVHNDWRSQSTCRATWRPLSIWLEPFFPVVVGFCVKPGVVERSCHVYLRSTGNPDDRSANFFSPVSFSGRVTERCKRCQEYESAMCSCQLCNWCQSSKVKLDTGVAVADHLATTLNMILIHKVSAKSQK